MASFHHHLTTWSGARLGRLLTARPDLLAAAANGLPALARKATSAPSLGRVLVGADVGMLVVAEALAARHPASVGELDELLGTGDPDAVAEAVERLERLGVVLTDEGVVTPVGALSDLLHRPLGLGPSMLELASHLDDEVIERLVTATGSQGGDRRSATIRALAHRLAQPEVVQGLLGDAPPDTVALFETLVAHRSPAIGLPAGFPYRGLDDDDPLEWLLARGLVVAVSDGGAELPRELVIASHPEGLAPGAHLRPVEVEPVDGLSADLIAGRAADAANRLLDGVESLLRLADQREISVRKAGGIGPRELARLARTTGLSVVETARMLELLTAARLVMTDGDHLVAADLAPRWWTLTRRRRFLVLIRSWMGAERFLSRGLPIEDAATDKPSIVALGDGEPLAAAVEARQATMTALASVPDGKAVEAANLAEAVVWQAPNLWGPGDPPPEALVAWTVAEAELLGLVADGAPSAIGRAIAAGDDVALDEASASVLADDQETFMLQADLSAVAFGPLAPAVGRALGEMTDRDGDTQNSRRFSETSLRRAFDRGWTEESITGFLTDHALSGVPQPLAYLLGDIARRYGTVKVVAAQSVIVTADEALAVEIATNRRASPLGLRLVAPTVLTATVDPVTAVETLRSIGQFPTLEGSSVVMDRPGSAGAPMSATADRAPGDRAGDPAGDRSGDRVGDPAGDLPADWTGPSVPDRPLPDEIEEAVLTLLAAGGDLDADPNGGIGQPEVAGGDGVGPSLERLWRRNAVIDVAGPDGVDRLTGIVVGLGDVVSLLTLDGIINVAASAVLSADDPNRS
jgi:hypothetical protein